LTCQLIKSRLVIRKKTKVTIQELDIMNPFSNYIYCL